MVRKLCQSHCFSIGCSRFAVRFGTPSKQAMVRKLYQNHCFSLGFFKVLLSAPGPRISKSKTAFFNPAELTECALSLRLACACPCPPRGPPRGSTPWIICEPGTRETDRQGTRACETILYKSLLFLTMPYKSLIVNLTKTFKTFIKQSKS